MEESDIIKSGIVYLPVKSFLKTTWVDKFCILHRKTKKDHAYIEVYTNERASLEFKSQRKECNFKRLELHHVISIKHLSESTVKSSEHKIEIQCRNQKHVLLFTNEHDSSEWYCMLNCAITTNGSGTQTGKVKPHHELEFQEVTMVNEMYGSTEPAKRFTVNVEPSDLAELCGIVGKMTMLIGLNRCAFENFVTKKIMYRYELAWMRRFGVKSEQFYFEIGRKCPNGEGTITCSSACAKLIYIAIQDMSNNMSMSNNQNAQVVPNNGSFKEDQEIQKSTLAVTEIDQYNVSMPQLPPCYLETPTVENSGPFAAPVSVTHIDKDIETSVLSHPLTKPNKDIIQTSKKLDENSKVQITNALKKGTLDASIKQNERVKENNEKEPSDKKRNEKDKKEKEKCLNKEKEEQKRLEKERKQKEKEDKKKSVSSKKAKKPKENKQGKDAQTYSEVSSESFTYAKCNEMHDNISAEMPPPYVTPIKHNEDSPYDEAISIQTSNEQNKMCNPGQQVKKDALILFDTIVYTEVSQVKSAGKDIARKDEHHEEDYPNTQKAHSQIDETPPLPTRNYHEESDDNEDTYDTATLKFNDPKGKQINKNEDATEHVYGIASAKAINIGLNLSTVPDEEHSGDSESKESGTETKNAYDNYIVPNEVKSSSLRVAHVPLYEDTVIPIKPKPLLKSNMPTTKPLAKLTLYEEI